MKCATIMIRLGALSKLYQQFKSKNDFASIDKNIKIKLCDFIIGCIRVLSKGQK